MRAARGWAAAALAAGLLLAGCGSAGAVAATAAVPSSSAGVPSRPATAHPAASAAAPRGAAARPPSSSAGSPAATAAPAASASAAPAKPPAPAAGPVPVPRMPTAVVIGNDPGARPQAGLARATVVWEILAEGWITRYLAVFDGAGAPKIGPIRSARIYFDQLAHAYGIPLAHAGGNVDALAWIPTLHVQNLDAIYGSGGYYWRGGTRIAPDNLYTSTALLNEAERRDGYRTPGLAEPARGAAPAGGTPTGGVRLNYLTDPPVYTYVSGWTWRGGWWYRSINGSQERTQDGSAIRAGTVIVLVALQAPDPDPHTPGALKILWQDGGAAWVLRGGSRWAGTWALGRNGLPAVRGAGGKPLPAGTRGPYWYEVVPAAADVSFS